MAVFNCILRRFQTRDEHETVEENLTKMKKKKTLNKNNIWNLKRIRRKTHKNFANWLWAAIFLRVLKWNTKYFEVEGKCIVQCCKFVSLLTIRLISYVYLPLIKTKILFFLLSNFLSKIYFTYTQSIYGKKFMEWWASSKFKYKSMAKLLFREMYEGKWFIRKSSSWWGGW